MMVADDVVALTFEEEAVGKLVSQSKRRYKWLIALAGQPYEIVLASTYCSGKRRILVNGKLEHEETTFRANSFKYSWMLQNHSLSIMPTWAVGETVYRSFVLSIDGRPFDTILNGGQQPMSAQLRIVINGAKGLRASDNSYCTCEIPGKRGTQAQTPVAKKMERPAWNHEHQIAEYIPGESLSFVVMEKLGWPQSDQVIGKVVLPSQLFYPWGFEGSVQLNECRAGSQVHVGIKVLVTGTPEEQRLREIFERCDANKDGSLNKRELIKILRVDQEVAEFFELPQQIKQEDGSRDMMERIFQEMDSNSDREVSWDEFRAFFARRPNIMMTPSPKMTHASPRAEVPPMPGSPGMPVCTTPRSRVVVLPLPAADDSPQESPRPQQQSQPSPRDSSLTPRAATSPTKKSREINVEESTAKWSPRGGHAGGRPSPPSSTAAAPAGASSSSSGSILIPAPPPAGRSRTRSRSFSAQELPMVWPDFPEAVSSGSAKARGRAKSESPQAPQAAAWDLASPRHSWPELAGSPGGGARELPERSRTPSRSLSAQELVMGSWPAFPEAASPGAATAGSKVQEPAKSESPQAAAWGLTSPQGEQPQQQQPSWPQPQAAEAANSPSTTTREASPTSTPRQAISSPRSALRPALAKAGSRSASPRGTARVHWGTEERLPEDEPPADAAGAPATAGTAASPQWPGSSVPQGGSDLLSSGASAAGGGEAPSLTRTPSVTELQQAAPAAATADMEPTPRGSGAATAIAEAPWPAFAPTGAPGAVAEPSPAEGVGSPSLGARVVPAAFDGGAAAVEGGTSASSRSAGGHFASLTAFHSHPGAGGSLRAAVATTPTPLRQSPLQSPRSPLSRSPRDLASPRSALVATAASDARWAAPSSSPSWPSPRPTAISSPSCGWRRDNQWGGCGKDSGGAVDPWGFSYNPQAPLPELTDPWGFKYTRAARV